MVLIVSKRGKVTSNYTSCVLNVSNKRELIFNLKIIFEIFEIFCTFSAIIDVIPRLTSSSDSTKPIGTSTSCSSTGNDSMSF